MFLLKLANYSQKALTHSINSGSTPSFPVYRAIGKFLANLTVSVVERLTFSLCYATLILKYTGIVVYFSGLKPFASSYAPDQQNKKQKLNGWLTQAASSCLGHVIYTHGIIYRAAASSVVTLFRRMSAPIAFCFLPKRIFVDKETSTTKSKNKNKQAALYDCRKLSSARHTTRDRSQQDNGDSLGRAGSNSCRTPRQPWLAVLHPRTGRGNYSVSQNNRLFPQQRRDLVRANQKPTRFGPAQFGADRLSAGFILIAQTIASYVCRQPQFAFIVTREPITWRLSYRGLSTADTVSAYRRLLN